MLFNKPRAEKYMREYGVDALIATSPANVTYASDYACWVDSLMKQHMFVPGAPSDPALQTYAAFALESGPALIVSAAFAVNAHELWVKDIYPFGSAGFDESLQPGSLAGSERSLLGLLSDPTGNATATDALLSFLRSRGLTDGRIGIEMEGLPAPVKDDLVRALPKAQLVDATNLLRLIRTVKSADEVARLTRAAAINEEISIGCLALARPGTAMRDIAAEFRAGVAKLGADFDHFAFGVRGLGIATEPSYTAQQADVLYVDFGCIYAGYFADSGRTLAIAELPTALEERYDALRLCVVAGSGAMRPGARGSEVQRAMREVLDAHGISASSPHGHGVGLEAREYPILVADNGLRIKDGCVDLPSDLPLEEGMVLNLEAALFFPGVASLHVEQSFLVTDRESRPLVPHDRERPFIPPR